jgi:hypothetical protein
VNDSPVNTVPGTQTVAEDGKLTFNKNQNEISISDVDAGDSDVTVTLTVSYGKLHLTPPGLSISGNDTNAVTITGKINLINNALNGMEYTPDPNFSDTDTLTITTNDNGPSGSGGPKTDTDTVTITVTPVNDAPTATNTTQTKTYTQGASSVALDDIVVTDVDAGEVITATLTLANPAAGALTGGGGIYSADTGVWTFTGSVGTVNTALAAVVFAPAANNAVDTTVAVSISDGEAPAVAGTITLNIVNGATAAIGDGEFTAAYMSGADRLWNSQFRDDDMNQAFGSGQWDAIRGYDPDALFGGYDFIFIDGSYTNSSEFRTFLNSHRDDLEDFVRSGGTLFLNAARNESFGPLDLGFGITSNNNFFDTAQNSGFLAVSPSHPISAGPNGNAGSSWTGGSFSHDFISGTGLNALITSSPGGLGGIILGELALEEGYALFGGMTESAHMQPHPQVDRLEANILDYAASFSPDYLLVA